MDKEFKEKVDEAYQWACRQTAEQGEVVDNFLWSSETRRLLRRLLKTQGNLIAVVGLQGNGKTETKQQLAYKLHENGGQKVLSMKWVGNYKEVMTRQLEEWGIVTSRDYLEELLETFKVGKGQPDIFNPTSQIDNITSYIQKKLKARIGLKGANSFIPYIKDYFTSASDRKKALKEMLELIPHFESIIGLKQSKQIKRRLLLESFYNVNTFLIDLPDYDRSNIREMDRDLTSIQAWWENELLDPAEGYRQEPNLVIFFQKELFKGHFFIGKLDVIELKPFSPEELALHFKDVFGDFKPFTKNALHQIAVLSRGIFRRFKKYIRICIENTLDRDEEDPFEITEEDVRNWIQLDQLIQDMELELQTVFAKQKENRKYSVIVLQLLAEKGPISQNEITKKVFDGSKMKASRILGKLEAWNYILRNYEGRDKMVSLA